MEGILFDAVAALPASQRPGREMVLKMSAQTAAIESRNRRINQVLVEVVKTYDSLQLPYLLLKGPAVAAAYRNPLHRTGGDLDFYLAPDDCRKAQETLFGDTTLASSTARHYSGKLHGVHIENHFRLAHSSLKRYRDFERELLSDRIRLPLLELDVNGYPVKCPSPTFQALFMLEHMAFHLPTGLGLRQLCDWACYLSFYSDRIDRTEAAGIIRKYGFDRIANLFTILCIDYLGMASGHALLSSKRDKYTERDIACVLGLILDGGNFGRNYDTLHSSHKHQRLPSLLRKPITFAVLLRNRRKYNLIAPDLWRKTVWESIVRHL